MADWRECTERGTEPKISGKARVCPVLRDRYQVSDPLAFVDDCARCDRPALLKAVDKARVHCGWLLSEYQDPEMAAKPGDIVDSTRYVYDLCTAALEQAKGEEARDAGEGLT